jgi:hypothetical protein
MNLAIAISATLIFILTLIWLKDKPVDVFKDESPE